MRIHHLDCGTMCARVVGPIVSHCLLVEGTHGLILVDTGFGTADLRGFEDRFPAAFPLLMRPSRDLAVSALHQVQSLGYHSEDVRDIVVTHLDCDHAGGLGDFPHARVHVFETERLAAMARATPIERERYRPLQFLHQPKWVSYQTEGDAWFGFDAVRAIDADANVLLIPLIGHTRGHCGVAVQDGERWLLHAGDAYFHPGEMSVNDPRCPLPLALFQRLIAIDDLARRHNQERLRALVRDHATEVDVFCAHSQAELDRFRPQRSSREAATPQVGQ